MEQGHDWFHCPGCGTVVSLLEEKREPIPDAVSQMDQAANLKRDREAAKLVIEGKIEAGEYDVFLCHNDEDNEIVEEIAHELVGRGIRPWLDDWDVPAFRRWQDELGKVISGIEVTAVFVGKSGFGPWQDLEIQAILNQFARDKNKRGGLVILPDCPGIPDDIPAFLDLYQWVDFRKTVPDPMDRLEAGIRGELTSWPYFKK